MFECERLFGATRGREVHEMIEESIGQACPCLRGEACPISGQVVEVQLTLPPVAS